MYRRLSCAGQRAQCVSSSIFSALLAQHRHPQGQLFLAPVDIDRPLFHSVIPLFHHSLHHQYHQSRSTNSSPDGFVLPLASHMPRSQHSLGPSITQHSLVLYKTSSRQQFTRYPKSTGRYFVVEEVPFVSWRIHPSDPSLSLVFTMMCRRACHTGPCLPAPA